MASAVEPSVLPYLESLGVFALMLLTGWSLPRLSHNRWWGVAWLASLLLVGALDRLRFEPALGRLEYLLYGPMALLLLGLPCLRTSRLLLQVLAGTLAVFVCCIDGLAPFLGPAFYAPPPARVNAEGVCLQPDGVSCGPAASVTALRRMGVAADFGDLVRAAHTSPAIGTPPDLLCSAIASLYPVQAELIRLERLEDLPHDQCLLLMNLDTWTDHYVALFRATDTQVEVGDPLRGRVVLARQPFDRRWRHMAIVIHSPRREGHHRPISLELVQRQHGFNNF